METGNSSKGGRGKEEEDVDELLRRLDLHEDDGDDFVWEEDVARKDVQAKWLAIARVLTNKGFSPSALYADMRSAWNPAKDVRWRQIEDNLFTVQFGCLGDWNTAMLNGPWLFRNQALILLEYDGFTNPRSIKLDKIAVWAVGGCTSQPHLHLLPLTLPISLLYLSRTHAHTLAKEEE
jgi:hypothetical protein